MKPERIVVRRATESDLPNIERHYGPLDNVGDPFCDTNNLTKIRYDHLLVAEIDGRYASVPSYEENWRRREGSNL